MFQVAYPPRKAPTGFLAGRGESAKRRAVVWKLLRPATRPTAGRTREMGIMGCVGFGLVGLMLGGFGEGE